VNPNHGTVVIVDDDRDMTNLVCDVLRQAGYNALSANSGSEALELVKQEIPDALISDLRMSGMNGHQLQGELKRLIPDLPIIIITAFGSIQSAVDAMKLGAFDYITKPFGNDQLLLILSRALENRRLRQEVKRLRGELARSYGLTNIIAANQKMAAVLDKLEQVADSSASVLIMGESGTGKELLARALHFKSRRRDAPFVPINCAAIPENLIESELFGYARGAFTDARQSKTGLFQAADDGTLFLDEIGDMPLTLQAKLLRIIEDKKVRPLGALEEIPTDVRIVSATSSDLEDAIAQGKFRSDLYYRLATFTLTVPPLRERPEDIKLLVKHFVLRASAEAGKPVPKIEPDTMASLIRYLWPGNVRELQNAIQSSVILCRESRLTIEDLPSRIAETDKNFANDINQAVTQRRSLEELERQYVRMVLVSVNGNKTEAAAILQIDRKTLYRKLEELESEE
jgi:two-component system response regulator HydG